jgi:hypothetical protein
VSVRRRGNGLTADSYVLLLDVDPRVSDALLAALATAGVAAYSMPAQGRAAPPVPPVPPARPREAVHVDSTRRPDARRVLEDTLPDLTTGLPSIAEEDSFAALVAGFDAEPTSRDWPSAEDISPPPTPPSTSPLAPPSTLPPTPPPTPPDQSSGPPQRRRTDQPPASGSARTAPVTPSVPADERAAPLDENTRADAAAAASDPDTSTADKPSLEKPDRSPSAGSGSGAPGGQDVTNLEPDEGFVPPPIEPMPPAHPVTKWGLVALGLGVVLLIFPTLLGLRHTTAVDVAGVLSILGGVGLLVSRLSNGSGDDDGPDDGAVV